VAGPPGTPPGDLKPRDYVFVPEPRRDAGPAHGGSGARPSVIVGPLVGAVIGAGIHYVQMAGLEAATAPPEGDRAPR